MNTLTFTKSINNIDWLDEGLRELSDKYEYFTMKGDNITLYFSVPIIQLNQEVINSISDYINDYVEVSIFDMQYNLQSQKTSVGFDLYKQIIADLNSGSGLGGYLDEQTMPFYLLLRPVRDMLKDGFFEFALRYFVTELVPLNIIPSEKATNYKKWIGDAAVSFGSDPQIVEAIKTVPKGAYPFGSVGAP